MTTVEYVIVLVLIAVGCITLWTLFGAALRDRIGFASEEIGGM